MSSLNKDSFSSSFLSFIPFISFSYLIVLAKTSSKMLAEVGGVSIFALLLILPESKQVKDQLALCCQTALHKVYDNLNYSAVYGVA